MTTTSKARERQRYEEEHTTEVKDVRGLAELWSVSGRKVEGQFSGKCTVAPCREMAFVALKTWNGRNIVCLTHFDAVRDAARQQQHAADDGLHARWMLQGLAAFNPAARASSPQQKGRLPPRLTPPDGAAPTGRSKA
jgi:hypothetical protein